MTTRTRIEVTGPADRPVCLLSAGALSPRRLRTTERGSGVRIALVAAQALLLAGDQVRVELLVDGPHHVTIVEIGGTVAHHGRGGPPASWDLDLTLRHGAHVTWEAQPLVIAAGADVARSTFARLDGDCTLALREVVVLGRSGEAGGALRTRTRLSQGGRPVLAEDLDLSAGRWAVLGGHRCLDTATTVGFRVAGCPGSAAPPGCDVLQAEAVSTLVRWTGDQLHLSSLPAVWEVVSTSIVSAGASVGPTRVASGRPEAPQTRSRTDGLSTR